MRSVLAFTAFLALTGRASAQPVTPDETVRAIRAGLPKLEAAEQSFTRYKYREQSSKNGQKLETSILAVRRSAAGEMLLSIGRLRIGLNSEAMFGVERPKPKGEWVVLQYQRTKPVETFRDTLKDRWAAFTPLTGIALNQSLSELLDRPTFRATSAKLNPDGLVELSYTSEVPNGSKEPFHEVGSLIVSPRQHYVVLEATHTVLDPPPAAPKVRAKFVRTVDDLGSVLRCRTLSYIGTDEKTGRELARDICEYTDYSTEPVDPAEFTLAYYQLPTPMIAPEDIPPSRWPWWVAGGGALCVGLSLVFRWLARRRASTQGGT